MPASHKRAYHHGDLRETLIAATLVLIETSGVQGFSLREVARQAGVSPRAPYRHFENRAALLAVIAERGYQTLAATLHAAVEPVAARSHAVSTMIDAYVAFARTHRAYFQVMFRPDAYDKTAHPEVGEAGDRAMSVVAQALSSYPAAAGPAAADLNVLSWTVAHGTASLLLDGAFDRRSALLRRTPIELAAHVARSFEGLLKPAETPGPPSRPKRTEAVGRKPKAH